MSTVYTTKSGNMLCQLKLIHLLRTHLSAPDRTAEMAPKFNYIKGCRGTSA